MGVGIRTQVLLLAQPGRQILRGECIKLYEDTLELTRKKQEGHSIEDSWVLNGWKIAAEKVISSTAKSWESRAEDGEAWPLPCGAAGVSWVRWMLVGKGLNEWVIYSVNKGLCDVASLEFSGEVGEQDLISPCTTSNSFCLHL